MKRYLILIWCCVAACGNAVAETIDTAAVKRIVEVLQEQVKKHPSAFPLEALDGGTQSFESGLRLNYFGYGERRFADRFDFHPAMDLAYFPLETGYVTTEQGETGKVRAPQTYLKKVYAIQQGELVSIKLISTGYKLVLKHHLEKPYYDSEGKPYFQYYTCYRHLDSRSLAYLSGVAERFTGVPGASYEDLFGKYVFAAGEQIALVGYSPVATPLFPRAHLDFSLNLFGDPDKGTNIRNYALNPLLLFPPFEYADPRSHRMSAGRLPAYTFIVEESGIVTPGKETGGRFLLNIAAGGRSPDGVYSSTRYFVLNGLEIVLMNGGQRLATQHIDRHRKLGYDTGSYASIDNPNLSIPHLLAPMGEQADVYSMVVVLPAAWFEAHHYDWSKPGSVEVVISSIWSGYLAGHAQALTLPIPVAKD